MNAHEPFADDLSLYALDALGGEDRSALEKHLQECSSCRRELEQLRGDAALLALSVSGPKPPARSRARLMAALAGEPRRAEHPAKKRAAWWSGLQWAGAVALVVMVLLLVNQNVRLKRQVANLGINLTRQDQQLLEADQLLATLTSKDAEHFTLVAGKTPPQPLGKAIYVRSSGTLVFLASNMPPLPAQRIYELWLIPNTGTPIPAGLFRPDAHGSASIVKPPLPIGVEAKTFAITIEPETGSPAPTSPIIMVATEG